MADNFIRCIDIETSHEDSAMGAIIEVGWTDIYTDLTVSEPSAVFVRASNPISFEARAVHHITDAEVASGIDPAALPDLVQSGSPRAFVAHNAKFEQSFMPFLPGPWLCTYKCSMRVWPEAPRHTNQVLRYWLGLDLPPALAMPAHRAGPDSYVTAHILAAMIRAEGEHRTRRLVAWSKEPSLLPRVPFNKHRGAAWSEVPMDYLQWIVRTPSLDDDARFTAQQEINRRRATVPSGQQSASLGPPCA